jgi:hypothetical protein
MAISWVVFACVFGGALLGMLLRNVLPEHHLKEDSKDAVKLGMALIATMSALVLGLLIASAKSSYDAQSGEVTQMSANIRSQPIPRQPNPRILQRELGETDCVDDAVLVRTPLLVCQPVDTLAAVDNAVVDSCL